MNPMATTPETIDKGQRLARQSCAECHGETGLGDGPAAAGMTLRPASWRTPEFQAQSDAYIFWKLSAGRGAMPPAGRMPEAERWQVISFIRKPRSELTPLLNLVSVCPWTPTSESRAEESRGHAANCAKLALRAATEKDCIHWLGMKRSGSSEQRPLRQRLTPNLTATSGV